jgi:hypothetical protein
LPVTSSTGASSIANNRVDTTSLSDGSHHPKSMYNGAKLHHPFVPCPARGRFAGRSMSVRRSTCRLRPHSRRAAAAGTLQGIGPAMEAQ